MPGRLQMFLEQVVGLFDGLAKSSSPWRNSFLGAYIFAAGVYIFSSTLFELFGFQGMPYYLIAIALSYVLSGYYGLYQSQKIVYSKYKNEYINRKTR